ncbi:MAG TPA: AtpZ/AtpI family protein [Candidatus Saccharimonadales bacterium]
MSTDAKPPTSGSHVPSKNTALLVFGTIADTTWRMFVPAVGGAILGVLADRAWGTKPWLTVAGITVGVIVAGLLVWLQLRQTNGDSK